MEQIRAELVTAFQGLLESIVAALPKVVVGIVLFLVALFVARVIERAIRATLTRLRFDGALETLGLGEVLRRVGVTRSVSDLLARFSYFLLLLLFLSTASEGLGLQPVSDAVSAIVGYLPNIIGAVLILLLGTVAAQAAGRVVARAGESAGIEFSSSLGSAATGVLLFVVGIMAIGQLRISTEIIHLVTTGLLAAFALAFGLSFGLGAREITRNILAGFYARKTFRMGERLQVGEASGILSAITPTQTILRNGDEMVVVANSVFLEEVVRQ
jgi:small-conductance mechanosensitive channel